MRMTTRLRALVEDAELLVMPGAYDVISARLAEEAGFKAIQASGANIVACHYGAPDYSLVSAREMAEQTGRIARSVDLPVMGDGDTGFGNAVNAWLTVRAFEEAGAAGINIEDQIFPKRCGHLEGKTLIDFDEAVAKVAAAVDARRDKDFVINARTDALSVSGLSEAIRRGNAFLRAGATMVFLEGADSVETIRQAVAGIDGPVAVNLVEGGKTPAGLNFATLQQLGLRVSACRRRRCKRWCRRCVRCLRGYCRTAVSRDTTTCWLDSVWRSGCWDATRFSRSRNASWPR